MHIASQHTRFAPGKSIASAWHDPPGRAPIVHVDDAHTHRLYIVALDKDSCPHLTRSCISMGGRVGYVFILHVSVFSVVVFAPWQMTKSTSLPQSHNYAACPSLSCMKDDDYPIVPRRIQQPGGASICMQIIKRFIPASILNTACTSIPPHTPALRDCPC